MADGRAHSHAVQRPRLAIVGRGRADGTAGDNVRPGLPGGINQRRQDARIPQVVTVDKPDVLAARVRDRPVAGRRNTLVRRESQHLGVRP